MNRLSKIPWTDCLKSQTQWRHPFHLTFALPIQQPEGKRIKYTQIRTDSTCMSAEKIDLTRDPSANTPLPSDRTTNSWLISGDIPLLLGCERKSAKMDCAAPRSWRERSTVVMHVLISEYSSVAGCMSLSLCQLTAINNGTYPIAKVLLRKQGGIL